ncbi:enoyl-CoA hydratase-related protein [Variovorax sp. J31P179]|uniref:enoyl-CoA hydratase-related protein n=1 Tax=Variovorax sp. J31P179 TaxID=3053508 RepID=UPI002576408B|nr:enoyl-CoA hydratase-related protein [Variovorax sp. J31P179]MDM0083592.1 enoyl-CoA hydratase-related protein [Variovorax sp. J31P179]
MSLPILVERDGYIATVVLNQPDKLNAMSKAMWAGLAEAMTLLSGDAAVRCIVVRGAGGKAFCPGADIGEFEHERSNAVQAADYGRVIRSAIDAMSNCPQPLVAQIDGVCVGGGLLIASLCDIRICGEASRFGVPVRNLGLVEAYAEMAPLVRLAGADVALEILLEGRIFGAAEAREKRLVTRVVPDSDVAMAARASASRIAEGAPLVARWHKKFARRLQDPRPIDEAEEAECYACFDTEDFRIGWAAFQAKRKPRFMGR